MMQWEPLQNAEQGEKHSYFPSLVWNRDRSGQGVISMSLGEFGRSGHVNDS